MDISVLMGKTLTSITGANTDSDIIVFECSDGAKYKMYHSQDCCENVSIEDTNGDTADLIDSPILLAEESSSNMSKFKQTSESETWTFYRLATINGYVDIRWIGRSNGYYSEGVNFEQIRSHTS